jgi:hypothetical protein
MNPKLEKIGTYSIIIFGGIIILFIIIAVFWTIIDNTNSGEVRLKLIEAKCVSMNQTMVPSIIVPQQIRCYDSNGEIHEYILEVT